MERLVKDAIPALSFSLSERARLLLASSLFFFLSGAILYLFLVATYPPVHDAVHDLRHALAVVPCH
jgi:cobalt transporter subunit CbtB